MLKRAIIPIAGKGTHLMPLTSVVPKALFPLVDGRKSVKAVLHVLLEEVRDAGIDNVCIIISPGQKEIVRRYLATARDSCGALLPSEISFIEQQEPRGFGDAVLQAKGFVGEGPFVLLLGDHIRISSSGQPSCILQVVEAFRKAGPKAMVGVHDVDEAVIHTMGVAAGSLVEERVFRCMEFVEKPNQEVARRRLRTKGLPEGQYLAHCGIYVFDAEIFSYLEVERLQVQAGGREVELAAAQLRLLQIHPESYHLCHIDGKAYDIGNPEGYLRAFTAIGGMDSERL